MKISIKIDDLTDGKVIALLNDHLQQMHLYSPPESVHALDESNFKDESVTYWSAWNGQEIAACGALKQLPGAEGEIKSMRTVPSYLRNGIAAQILELILDEAVARGYQKLNLETGSHDAFLPAIALYKRAGFIECGPFADYELDPHSVFLTKTLVS